MAHEEVFGVGHPLHAEGAAGIGVGHAHVGLVEPERLDEVALMHPDTLPVVGQMQPRAIPFRVASPRLDRVHDDPVVAHLERNGPRRRLEGGIGRGLIAHAPVEGAVVIRLGVQCLTAACEGNLGGQFVHFQHDQLRRVAGLLVGVGHHQRHRLADIADLVLGQHRAQRRRRIAAVAVLDRSAADGDVHARCLQIGAGERPNAPPLPPPPRSHRDPKSRHAPPASGRHRRAAHPSARYRPHSVRDPSETAHPPPV